MSEQDILAALDFPVELGCDYPMHDTLGHPGGVAKFMVRGACAYNDCFDRDYVMCEACFTKPHMAQCYRCGVVQSPELMLHFAGTI